MTNSKCIAGRPEHTIIAVFALLIVLFAIGIVLTFKAYVRQDRKIAMRGEALVEMRTSDVRGANGGYAATFQGPARSVHCVDPERVSCGVTSDRPARP
jgi:hypothetical protein